MGQAPPERTASSPPELHPPHRAHSLDPQESTNHVALVNRKVFNTLDEHDRTHFDALRGHFRSSSEAQHNELCIQVRDLAIDLKYDDLVAVLSHMVMHDCCSHYRQITRVFIPVLGYESVAGTLVSRESETSESSCVSENDPQWRCFFDRVRKGSWSQTLVQVQQNQMVDELLETPAPDAPSIEGVGNVQDEAQVDATKLKGRLDWKYDDSLLNAKPSIDRTFDQRYRQKWLEESARAIEPRFTHGSTTRSLLLEIVEKATLPNTEESNGPVETFFCSALEADSIAERSSRVQPIITNTPSQFPRGVNLSRIEHFLSYFRYANVNDRVSVQDPTKPSIGHSFHQVQVRSLVKRFTGLSDAKNGFAGWNALDIRNPLPCPVAPSFVNNPNSTLLSDIQNHMLGNKTAGRESGSIEEYSHWRQLQHWGLLSESGHNTAPHIDSHGLATWITVEQGCFGFGWNTNDSGKEHEIYAQNPQRYTGGSWRFVILKPGQTIFFNSGTIHFVFRILGEPTLALGGHILQYSNLKRWLDILELQHKYPNSTNEDIDTKHVLQMLSGARRSVENRLRLEELGAMGTYEEVEAIIQRIEAMEKVMVKEMKAKEKSDGNGSSGGRGRGAGNGNGGRGGGSGGKKGGRGKAKGR